MAEAAGALEALRAAPVEGDALRVDAAALATFDSAALALLLQARREARARGRGFELHGAPPGLRQLARLYGVGELLGLEPA